MFIKRGEEFQRLKGSDQNSNALKEKKKIPVFIKIGLEF